MSPTPLDGPERVPTRGSVKHLVIFLHGLGADGNDLLGLADMMNLPNTQFVSPNAPFPCDMAPYGYQWFSLLDRSPAAMLAGVKTAAPLLDQYLDAQMKRFALTPTDVVLVGFSQGAMMSLYTAPRRAKPLAGIVAMSGALIGGETLAGELKSKPPVCLIHGTDDEVVPFTAMALAETALRANTIPVTAYPRAGLGHGIDEPALDHMQTALRKWFTL